MKIHIETIGPGEKKICLIPKICEKSLPIYIQRPKIKPKMHSEIAVDEHNKVALENGVIAGEDEETCVIYQLFFRLDY